MSTPDTPRPPARAEPAPPDAAATRTVGGTTYTRAADGVWRYVVDRRLGPAPCRADRRLATVLDALAAHDALPGEATPPRPAARPTVPALGSRAALPRALAVALDAYERALIAASASRGGPVALREAEDAERAFLGALYAALDRGPGGAHNGPNPDRRAEIVAGLAGVDGAGVLAGRDGDASADDAGRAA